MCGITGIVNFHDRPIDTKLLWRMVETVNHRGPDDQGAVVFSQRNIHGGQIPPRVLKSNDAYQKSSVDNHHKYTIGLGHRRLSIQDLSEQGHQPMPDAAGELWIVFNGEIYNYIELRDELQKCGYHFRTGTDTEVILYAYREWGTDCLNRFNGMWAFAIWDAINEKLICARDRYGVKPFYYFKDRNVFLFGSEIKQLLEYPGISPQPNDEIVFDYLVIGIEDHTDQTFFNHIFQLRGGEFATLDVHTGKFKKEQYYQYPAEQRSHGDDASVIEEFQALFNDAVSLRLRSDVPVGSSLSGGVDSSSVVCMISEIRRSRKESNPFEIFTACWKDSPLDESRFSDEIVRQTGVNANKVFPNAEGLAKDLERLIWHQDEPFGSLSIFAQWSVMKTAREKGVPVLLDGQGGDEILLGYERYYAWYLMELVKTGRPDMALMELKKAMGHSGLNFIRMIQFLLYFNIRALRGGRLQKRAKRFVNRRFLKQLRLSERLSIYGRNTSMDAIQRNEIRTTQLSHLLKYADRNSMAFSVETRLPFLDFRLVEFSLTLPTHYKIRDGWTKYMLREAMTPYVPSQILRRKDKLGFAVPQETLLQGVKAYLATVAEDMAERIEPYVQPCWLLNQMRNPDIGDHYAWRALCLGLWLKVFFK